MDRKYKIARKLRKNSTEEERKLWNLLRNRKFVNLKFKRQFPIYNYIVDFCCEEKKVVIEIDGGQHNSEENIEQDIQRTKIINEEGYKVFRFWNNEINENIEGVYLKLLEIFRDL